MRPTMLLLAALLLVGCGKVGSLELPPADDERDEAPG
jgi:predicted small lipoprotein YifL